MKRAVRVCAIVLALACGLWAQDPGNTNKAEVTKRPADASAFNKEAKTIKVTADGKILLGDHPVGLAALSRLSAKKINIKADANAPYRTVLAVLNALHGRSAALLLPTMAKEKSGLDFLPQMPPEHCRPD